MKGQDLTNAIALARTTAKEVTAEVQVSRNNMEPAVYAHYADTLVDELMKLTKELQHDVRIASRKKLI
tara:strand:+ start:914 stop:1117 length:204 start_codon:yes stop_codon:yes gene_type:complete